MANLFQNKYNVGLNSFVQMKLGELLLKLPQQQIKKSLLNEDKSIKFPYKNAKMQVFGTLYFLCRVEKMS